MYTEGAGEDRKHLYLCVCGGGGPRKKTSVGDLSG